MSLAAFTNPPCGAPACVCRKKILVVPLPIVALLPDPLAEVPGVDQRREHIRYGTHV
jgi:hypothetical protein